MNNKIDITIYAMKQHGEIITDKSIKKFLSIIWQNPRNKSKGGLRLTYVGYKYLIAAGIKRYLIWGEEAVVDLTNQEIIWLDQQMDCPFYIDYKKIFVFTEKEAIQLALFSGQIINFVKIKARRKDLV